jgi:hypothetical protein
MSARQPSRLGSARQDSAFTISKGQPRGVPDCAQIRVAFLVLSSYSVAARPQNIAALVFLTRPAPPHREPQQTIEENSKWATVEWIPTF